MPNRLTRYLSRMPASRRHVLVQLLIIGVAVLVSVLLVRHLDAFSLDDIRAAFARLPASTLALAIGLTVLDYLWLVSYDALALRYLRRDIPWPRLALGSLSAFALERNVGPVMITGAAMRYRYFRRHGISLLEAGVITFLCGICYTLGCVLAGGLALLLQPAALARAVHLPAELLRLGGAGLLLGLAAYLYWTAYRQHPIRVRRWRSPPPSLRLSLAQLGAGLVDLALLAAVTYVLLPGEPTVGFLGFIGFYLLAEVAGALSRVPGGLGVFEGVMLLLLPGVAPGALLAALIARRAIYYLMPLAVMGAVVGLRELSLLVLRVKRVRNA